MAALIESSDIGLSVLVILCLVLLLWHFVPSRVRSGQVVGGCCFWLFFGFGSEGQGGGLTCSGSC